MYVNIRDQKKIGVIDLKEMRVVDAWSTSDLNLNTSMALDQEQHRLFVVGRKPGIFYAFDTVTGKVVSHELCMNIADGMAWDADSKRIYIFASEGMSVFHQDSPDRYSLLSNIPTNGGKTGLLHSAGRSLFVVHPKTSIDDAGLLVFHVNP